MALLYHLTKSAALKDRTGKLQVKDSLSDLLLFYMQLFTIYFNNMCYWQANKQFMYNQSGASTQLLLSLYLFADKCGLETHYFVAGEHITWQPLITHLTLINVHIFPRKFYADICV